MKDIDRPPRHGYVCHYRHCPVPLAWVGERRDSYGEMPATAVLLAQEALATVPEGLTQRERKAAFQAAYAEATARHKARLEQERRARHEARRSA